MGVELTNNAPGFLPKSRLHWVPSVHGPKIPQHHAVHTHASKAKEIGKYLAGYGENEDFPGYKETEIPPTEGVFAPELRPLFEKHLGTVTWPREALSAKEQDERKGAHQVDDKAA